MAPDGYRLYRLDRGGMIHDAEWFQAADDADARTRIEAKHTDSTCEIWQGKRLVAKVWPKGLGPDDPELQNAVGERLSALANRIRLGLEPGL